MTKRLTIALIALVALVLVAVLPVSATYYSVNNTLTAPGAVVYIGEQQLNLSAAQTSMAASASGQWFPGTVGWWASAAQITTTAPSTSVILTGSNTSFYVSPAAFSGYTGNWYPVVNGVGNTSYGALFNVYDPSVVVDVWDVNTSTTVTSGTVIQGDWLTFRVNTNLQAALDPTHRANDATGATTPVTLANMDIKVKPASGNTYTSLFVNQTSAGGATYQTMNINLQNVTLPLWFYGTLGNTVPTNAGIVNVWATGAVDATGQNAYPAGVYTVTAQSDLNGMYDNYLNGGATYTGKTVSQPATVTISSNTVAISANVNSVVRSKPFSVTITGKPNAVYHLWVKGVSTMDGTYDNQPPIITQNQAGIAQDPIITNNARFVPAAPYSGAYTYQNGVPIYQDVASGTPGTTSAMLGNGSYEYANVTLDQTGTRTIQWTTTNWTRAQQYTIRVEQNFNGSVGVKYDEVMVQVQKGAVTIVAAGSQSYYLGEEVQLSGTNTESQTTYLFVTGPNLPTQGTNLASTDPRNYIPAGATAKGVQNGNANSFQNVAVNGDNTWSWNWGTATVALDAGTYTIYAVSQPMDANNLANVAYGTVSVIIKKPFVSATASQSTVAQGDPVYVTGTAQGQPTNGVAIWILGKNFYVRATQSVNSDASFSYQVKGATTSTMYAGQYFIVVQHPMQNGLFDVAPVQLTDAGGNQFWAVNTSAPLGSGASPTIDFKLTGAGSLQGSDAAEALVTAINSPNVDDTYTKLQLLVETPVITVTPVGDRHVGDKFTITATTNLAVGDNILFTVYSSSFQPTDKTQSGQFSGASGTVAVTQGTNGLNQASFDVDASTFKPDEYLVTATAVGLPNTNNVPTGTALFNVLQAQAPTATATPVATVTTAAAPTTIATPIPTTVVPTTTKSPGFGALVALIGLGAVAFIIVRRD